MGLHEKFQFLLTRDVSYTSSRQTCGTPTRLLTPDPYPILNMYLDRNSFIKAVLSSEVSLRLLSRWLSTAFSPISDVSLTGEPSVSASAFVSLKIHIILVYEIPCLKSVPDVTAILL